MPTGDVSRARASRLRARQEKEDRAKGLYDADKLSQVKRSEENPVMMALYGGV